MADKIKRFALACVRVSPYVLAFVITAGKFAAPSMGLDIDYNFDDGFG
jgi:hypothetical protein